MAHVSWIDGWSWVVERGDVLDFDSPACATTCVPKRHLSANASTRSDGSASCPRATPSNSTRTCASRRPASGVSPPPPPPCLSFLPARAFLRCEGVSWTPGRASPICRFIFQGAGRGCVGYERLAEAVRRLMADEGEARFQFLVFVFPCQVFRRQMRGRVVSAALRCWSWWWWDVSVKGSRV